MRSFTISTHGGIAPRLLDLRDKEVSGFLRQQLTPDKRAPGIRGAADWTTERVSTWQRGEKFLRLQGIESQSPSPYPDAILADVYRC
jgi:hypothetical protein